MIAESVGPMRAWIRSNRGIGR